MKFHKIPLPWRERGSGGEVLNLVKELVLRYTSDSGSIGIGRQPAFADNVASKTFRSTRAVKGRGATRTSAYEGKRLKGAEIAENSKLKG